MAMSFNNKGPFGGFYRYIGEEDTYKIYRDSMTDSDGKEVPLDPMLAFDRQDVEFVGAIREGREPESSAASCRADDGAARQDRQGDERLIARPMIIDCHGHYTTAPKGLQAFRDAQIAGLKDPPARATKGTVNISDDEIRESLERRAAEAAARARHRRHDLLAARVGDGASHRRRDDQPALDRALQRSDPPRLRAVSGELRRRLPAAADAGASRSPTASPSSSAASTSSGSSAAI